MAIRNGFPDEVLGQLYPFEDRYVELDDGRFMHYIETGRSGLRRPTLLLLHGNPTWSFLYRNFMERLGRSARVIAVDHVGFGRSDHPNDPAYYTLERHINNLEQFVEKKKLKRVIPVMQDWGGPIGLGWATRHPDKLAGLVVMNTWAFVESEQFTLPRAFRFMRSRPIGGLAFGKFNLFVEKMIPMGTRRDLEPQVMEGYRHPFTSRDSREGIVQFPRMIPDKPKNPNWATMRQIERNLANLNVPARILWAEDDMAFKPELAHAFSRALPRRPVPTFLPGAGHYLQEDAPERLVEEIEMFVRNL